MKEKDIKIRVFDAEDKVLTLPEGHRIEIVRHDPKDIKLSPQMYSTAADRKMSLTALLEEADPSDRDANGQITGLDAFERQMQRFGIVTRAIPSAGITASEGSRFFQSNTPESAILFPEFINRVARMAIFEPDTVDELIGNTRNITGSVYESVRISWNEDDVLKRRVAEGDAFPEATITWADEADRVFKYGVAVNTTYEFIRRCPLDLLTTVITIIVKQNRLREADDAITVLRADMDDDYQTNANGAGGEDASSTAVATPRNLSFRGFLSWAMRFYPYSLTTLVANKQTLLTLVTMAKPSLDPFQVLSAMKQGPEGPGFNLVQSFWNNYRLVYNESLPENKILGINKMYAMERIVEVGADLVETEKIISRQFNKMVISESHGYSKIMPNCIRELTLN